MILPPVLSGEVTFGIASNNFDCFFPNDEMLSQMPLDKEIKLSAIKYKQFDKTKFLSGMQLEWSNGMKSPMFQAGMEAELG